MAGALLADCRPSVSSLYSADSVYLTSRLHSHNTSASVVKFPDAQEFIRAMWIVLEPSEDQYQGGPETGQTGHLFWSELNS